MRSYLVEFYFTMSNQSVSDFIYKILAIHSRSLKDLQIIGEVKDEVGLDSVG